MSFPGLVFGFLVRISKASMPLALLYKASLIPYFLPSHRAPGIMCHRFERIDLAFKDLMKSVSLTPTVVIFCSEVTPGGKTVLVLIRARFPAFPRGNPYENK